MKRALVLLALVLSACDSEALVRLRSHLRFALVDPDEAPRSLLPPTLELAFPPRYVGASPRSLPVDVFNEGRVTLSVTWKVDAPFSGTFPEALPPGATRIEVELGVVEEAGAHRGRLVVSSSNGAQAELALAASAWPQRTCVPPSSCFEASFAPDEGRCIESVLPDGTSCSPGTLCLEAASCQGGRCVGKPRACDDGNACTVDVCHAETGCEHLPAPPCPGDGVCQVGVCDPSRGCVLAPAMDGTRCGPQQTCVAAQVCLNGACVVRDPPDGYVCEEASPCHDEGRCVGTRCVHREEPRVLRPSWGFDSLLTENLDAGIAPIQLHDFLLEPSGAVTLSGWFNTPTVFRANVISPPLLAPLGASRRCILWNGRLVCADYPFPSAPNGRVTALDLATGGIVWNFVIQSVRPEYTEVAFPIFLARLVVMGTDRLAALYEAYPVPAPSNNNLCRRYFLVVLDAGGRLVTAQPLSHPLLEVCNHPHPYGAAADTVGNLYLAFSPTANNGTPLLPDKPTLLMSYSRDGVFRWRVLDDSFEGGELGVARGLLYPENSPVVLSAATGEKVFSLERPLGRAVVSETKMIPAPQDGTSSLSSYEAGSAERRWTHELSEGLSFYGEQLRLARWATSNGPRTVALMFSTDGTGRSLHAIDVENGQTAFRCELDLHGRTWPQLFEVADGHVALMHGALDSDGRGPSCGKCDPPFAGSSAAFEVFDTVGLSTSPDPWPGTFGGPSHDHHEKPGAAPVAP